MRLALLSVLLVLLSGCSRWAGTAAARREVLSDGLQALRFPLRPDEAAMRLRGQLAVVTRCDRQPTGELRCGGCVRGRCFEFLEENGSTRVSTRDELSEAELTSLWQPLDAESLTALRAEMPALVQDKLIEQEQRFEPRWGLTAGVMASLNSEISAAGSVALGGRVGVRRWFDVHLVGHAAVEYRYRGEHEFSLRTGLEIARWTEGRLWGGVGVPAVSVSMFMGPIFRAPIFRAGLRTGVGVHLTDLRSAPVFAEIAADTYFAGEASRVAATFTIGLGL